MANLINLKEKYFNLIFLCSIFLFFIGLVLLYNFQDSILWQTVGTAFIQLSITIIVIELFISYFGKRLFKKEIAKMIRSIIGIKDPENKLLDELIKLNNPYPYNILFLECTNEVIQSKKINGSYNLDILETTSVKVKAQEDNIHFHFQRGGSGKKDLNSLEEISINKIILEKKDLVIDTDNIDDSVTKYIIKHRFKEGEVYDIKIVYRNVCCMSDLSRGNLKKDYFTDTFFELTKHARLIYKFPFDINGYHFGARKKGPCHREKLIKIKPLKQGFTITEENLYGGDTIEVLYWKK